MVRLEAGKSGRAVIAQEPSREWPPPTKRGAPSTAMVAASTAAAITIVIAPVQPNRSNTTAPRKPTRLDPA